MFNEEYLTKKLIFSKKTCAAFSLLAGWGARKESAQICTQKRKSVLQGFSSRIFGAFIVGVCLSFVSCANIFQDKVAMSRNGTPATLGDIFMSGATVGKLDTPSEINVSQYEFKDKIRVSWSPVKNASYYILKRAVVEKDEKGEWKKKQDDVSLDWKDIGRIYGTSYIDKIITDDMNNDDELDYRNKKYENAYYYSVSAWNTLLGYDESDEKVSTWGVLLQPPSNARASMGSSDKYIKITWKGVDGATRYELYRSSQADGRNSTRIAFLYPNETTYQDNNISSFNGKEVYYTICSVGYTNERSVTSSVAMGYALKPGAPVEVNDVSVTKGQGEDRNSIEIEWKTVGDGIFYNVYRTSYDANTRSYDNTMISLASELSFNEEEIGTYKDEGIKAKFNQNIYYYYYVQTCKKETENGEEVVVLGSMSKSGPANDIDEVYSNKYAEGFILSAPSSVEVQKPYIEYKNDPYTILFKPSIGDKKFPQGAKGVDYDQNYEYIVLGGEGENESFKEISTKSPEPRDDGYSISLNDSTYKFYKMKTRNKVTGGESEETSVVAPTPYAPTDVYVTCAALVGEYSNYWPNSTTVETDPGSNGNGVHPVKIVWTAPEGGDAAYYNIYRKENINGGWGTPLNAEPLSETSYTDKNESAKIGTIYYYSVVSLNSLKQGSKRSTVENPTLIGTGADAIIKTYSIDIDGKVTRCGKGWGWGALSAWQYMREECKTIESSHKKLTYMNKPNNFDKMGTETQDGDISGSVYYNASMSAYVTMTYTNYADFYINGNKSLGIYFLFNGNTNTSANISANGHMEKTLGCNGMYPGSVIYDNIQIKGGNAAGGTYGVIRNGIDSSAVQVDWTAGEK